MMVAYKCVMGSVYGWVRRHLYQQGVYGTTLLIYRGMSQGDGSGDGSCVCHRQDTERGTETQAEDILQGR